MTAKFVKTGVAIVMVSALSAAGAHAQPGGPRPAVPGNLVVNDDYKLVEDGHAIGTQNYICLPAPGGAAWKFVAPQATLFERRGAGRQLATHFLSANPEEAGLYRPTWQHSHDSSRVWGRLLRFSTDSNFVDPTAIPWLLLERAGAASGLDGSDRLAHVALIQRVNTAGGLAPSTGCTQASDVGALALVPYEADYFFYERWR